MAVLSCWAFAAVAVGPAFVDEVTTPPAADATRHDITMLMREEFLNRVLLQALPATVPVDGRLDVLPGNRLAFDGEAEVLITKVRFVMTLLLTYENGELGIAIESVEAAGHDLTSLAGLSSGLLTDALSGPLQRQVEEGLGPGADIVGISTDHEHIIIAARWTQ
jgi:hypothetical protein